MCTPQIYLIFLCCCCCCCGGTNTVIKLSGCCIQVEPLSLRETIIEVSKAIYGPNSTTAELLKSGNQQKATLTSLFTLTATEGTGMSHVETNSVNRYFNKSVLSITHKQQFPFQTRILSCFFFSFYNNWGF